MADRNDYGSGPLGLALYKGDSALGSVTDIYPNLQNATKVQGITVASGSPNEGDILEYTNSEWTPSSKTIVKCGSLQIQEGKSGVALFNTNFSSKPIVVAMINQTGAATKSCYAANNSVSGVVIHLQTPGIIPSTYWVGWIATNVGNPNGSED